MEAAICSSRTGGTPDQASACSAIRLNAAHPYHFLEHIRDRREQRLAVEMTSGGAVDFEERRELIGPQGRRPLGSRLKLVGGLLDGASLRSPTQRRVSTRGRREITKHAACTYRQV